MLVCFISVYIVEKRKTGEHLAAKVVSKAKKTQLREEDATYY